MLRVVFTLAAVAVLGLVSVASAGPIGSVTVIGTGLDSAGWALVPNAFAEDVDAFTDRTHEWNGDVGQPTISGLGLNGADYVKFANDDRSVGDLQAQLTLGQSADVYVFIDDRVSSGNVTNILNGLPLGYIGHTIGVDENGDGVGPGVSIQNNARIYRLAGAPAGTLTLGPQGQGGTNMYGVAALAAADAPLSMDDVHIDIGPVTHEVQLGHAYVNGPPPGTNGSNLPATPVTVGDTTFTVAIDNFDTTGTAVGGIDWRDRGNSVNSAQDLVDLGEDFIKNNAGVLRLILDDLPVGDYDFTSYHRDPDNSQSDQIAIWLNTGDGSGYVDTGAVGDSGGDIGNVNDLTTAIMLSSFAQFSFAADGISPVMIVFDGRASADDETPLNGFRLQFTALDVGTVPEPATLSLLVLAACALGICRRRRPQTDRSA